MTTVAIQLPLSQDSINLSIPKDGYCAEAFNHPSTEKRNVAGVGSGLFATADMAQGTVLFSFVGRPCAHKSRWTVQIGEDQHIGVVDGQYGQKWQYMNHCCDPNMQLRVTPLENGISRMDFVAFRPIHKEDEVTFNYLTTEWHMDEPFTCMCGSAEKCFKEIKGFSHIHDEGQKERLKPFLLPYLKDHLNE